MAVAARVGEPVEDQDASPLGQAAAVGGGRERLAAPVRGHSAQPAELGDRARGGHDGNPAGERQAGFPAPYCLAGQEQRDQRRRAGSVDGNRGTGQAHQVGDPPGDHAVGRAGQPMASDVRRRVVQRWAVLLPVRPGEYGGVGVTQAAGVYSRVLERLPGHLQNQALLRVHGQRLTGRDAEKGRVEVGGTVQKPALADAAGTRARWIQAGRAVQVPAAVGRERADGVAFGEDQIPQLVWGAHVSGEAAADADDGDRRMPLVIQRAKLFTGCAQLGGDTPEVVEDLDVLGHWSAARWSPSARNGGPRPNSWSIRCSSSSADADWMSGATVLTAPPAAAPLAGAVARSPVN